MLPNSEKNFLMLLLLNQMSDVADKEINRAAILKKRHLRSTKPARSFPFMKNAIFTTFKPR